MWFEKANFWYHFLVKQFLTLCILVIQFEKYCCSWHMLARSQGDVGVVEKLRSSWREFSACCCKNMPVSGIAPTATVPAIGNIIIWGCIVQLIFSSSLRFQVIFWEKFGFGIDRSENVPELLFESLSESSGCTTRFSFVCWMPLAHSPINRAKYNKRRWAIARRTQ